MHHSGGIRAARMRKHVFSSLRAERSNPDSHRGHSLDCFVASLLAMTAEALFEN